MLLGKKLLEFKKFVDHGSLIYLPLTMSDTFAETFAVSIEFPAKHQ